MNRNGLPIRSADFEALAGDFAGRDHPSYYDLVPGAHGPSSAVELSHLCLGRDVVISKLGRGRHWSSRHPYAIKQY